MGAYMKYQYDYQIKNSNKKKKSRTTPTNAHILFKGQTGNKSVILLLIITSVSFQCCTHVFQYIHPTLVFAVSHLHNSQREKEYAWRVLRQINVQLSKVSIK